MGWHTSTLCTKRSLGIKDLLYVRGSMVLRVRLMYLFKGSCYVHRSPVYMDPSYVLYIRQTLYKMQVVYYYGTILCTLIMHQSARGTPSLVPRRWLGKSNA